MDKFKIENDIIVYCITAKSFPEGIEEAHKILHSYAQQHAGRNYYGISYPDRMGNIIYKAAATETNKGEFSKQKLEEFAIPRGEYFRIIIYDYKKNVSAVGEAFDKIIADPEIDPKGFCLEWYTNDNDVWCMVRMAGN